MAAAVVVILVARIRVRGAGLSPPEVIAVGHGHAVDRAHVRNLVVGPGLEAGQGHAVDPEVAQDREVVPGHGVVQGHAVDRGHGVDRGHLLLEVAAALTVTKDQL